MGARVKMHGRLLRVAMICGSLPVVAGCGAGQEPELVSMAPVSSEMTVREVAEETLASKATGHESIADLDEYEATEYTLSLVTVRELVGPATLGNHTWKSPPLDRSILKPPFALVADLETVGGKAAVHTDASLEDVDASTFRIVVDMDVKYVEGENPQLVLARVEVQNAEDRR